MATKREKTIRRHVIARVWHGRTTLQKADEYKRYLEATGFKDYNTTEGNMGLLALKKTDSSAKTADFLLISLWKSIASIKKFAGTDIGKAVYYPRDKEFLLEMEPGVSHYEVIQANWKISHSNVGIGKTRNKKSM